MVRISHVAVLVVVVILFASGLGAQEGMWPLNQVPVAEIEKAYHFTPTPQWISRVQRSAVRLPNCSGSFVSATGLVATNGHCAEGAVQALSTPADNLYEKGFYAATLGAEKKTTLTLKNLVSMEDVTGEVNTAIAGDRGNNPAAVRSITLREITQSTSRKTGLDCEVIVLYQGARYDIYCYKVYTDVRLVFSTPKTVWLFGGDADNFEYPRYNLDVAFLRAYENGAPAKTTDHFGWSAQGVMENDPVFVAGHPGRTNRLYTSAALEAERDVVVPTLLDLFRRIEIATQQFAIRGAEEKRISESDLFGWQNSRKLYVGKIRGLQDPTLIKNKKDSERQLLADATHDSVSLREAKEGFALVEDAEKDIRALYPRVILSVSGFAFNTVLFDYAIGLAAGNAAETLEQRRDAPPLNLAYEEAKLVSGLSHLVEVFGANDPLVVNVMNGKGPVERARELVYGSALANITKHEELVMRGETAINASNDPMLLLARAVIAETQDLRRAWFNAKEKERQGYVKLNGAMFGVYGTTRYPDATFTLRLAHGTVRGYTERNTPLPAWTTLGGAYDHAALHGNQGDWRLPDLWKRNKRKVNLSMPLNFVSTLDITGGNSGSPVVNKDLEIVGLVFDSNIQGLVSDYDYTYSPLARAIAVDARGIMEALKNIYGAKRLVKELTSSH